MPPSLRNRGGQALDPDETDSENELHFGAGGGNHPGADAMDDEDIDEDLDEEADEDEEFLGEGEDPDSPNNSQPNPLNLDPPPPYLRDISTLASWTVSSSKPGCSIPQLRHPSTSLFWQSDGPQPHYLNIHFSKQVSIVALRLYLDFEQDESYTPTRIVFLAGSGGNDLVEWGEWRGESPRGWVWIDFSNVGDDSSDEEVEDGPVPRQSEDGSSDSENNAPNTRQQQQQQQQQQQTPINNHLSPLNTHSRRQQHHLHTPNFQSTPHLTSTPTLLPTPAHRIPLSALPVPIVTPRRPHLPVLRAHLVQIKIMENHQNGKDTHLRGLQVFARNDKGQRRDRDRERERETEEVEELGGLDVGWGEGGIR
jgi:anaphase-promoting complex subunit 10